MTFESYTGIRKRITSLFLCVYIKMIVVLLICIEDVAEHIACGEEEREDPWGGSINDLGNRSDIYVTYISFVFRARECCLILSTALFSTIPTNRNKRVV